MTSYGNIPDAQQLHPLQDHPRITFLQNLSLPPNVSVGAYSYYDDEKGAEAFQKNILYHFEFTGDHLKIGKFCALASGTKFMMNGGNHRIDAFSTYPFMIFGGDWANRFPEENDFPSKGDTVIGNDVWMGWNSVMMPGIEIGDGAIIASHAVVTKDVPPYAIVAGNPATIIRLRFSEEIISILLKLKWWNWDVDTITTHLPIISGSDVGALKSLCDNFTV
ncbi:MAG: CatB-related O-acetyltransferase [Pseudomonadota bacterium]